MIFCPADFNVYHSVLRFYCDRVVSRAEFRLVTGRIDHILWPYIEVYPN